MAGRYFYFRLEFYIFDISVIYTIAFKAIHC